MTGLLTDDRAYSESVASLHHDLYLLLMQEKEVFLFKASKWFLKSIFSSQVIFFIEGSSVVI